MLQLELNNREQETLAEVLKMFLSDLRTEVVHTDRLQLRSELRNQEQTIKDVLSRLSP